MYADKDYFNFIHYQWIAGSPTTALLQPFQTVLTVKRAKQYFPELTPAQAVGKVFFINDTTQLTISGIVEDLTANTDFTFETFIAAATLQTAGYKPQGYDQWGSTNGAFQLYIKLAIGTTQAGVEKQMAAIFHKNNPPKPGDAPNATVHRLQLLTDIHFNADYGTYNIPTTSKPLLYGLLAIATFLLSLGCINFINLTTAYATQRAKEIGVRKTLGSSRKQLILQFFSETFLLALLSTIVSIFLTPLILKAFAGFVPSELHLNPIQQPVILPFLGLLLLIVTVLSGLYPALLLSRYKPVAVLKNQTINGTTRNARLRKSLTVSQFVIAQVFVMATILVGKQINYALNKNMGFRKEAIVHFETNYYDTVKGNRKLLQKELEAIPGVSGVTLSSLLPSSNSTWSGTVVYDDGTKNTTADVLFEFADTNYIRLYQIPLLAGHNIGLSDTVKEALINETLLHRFGFQRPEQAIGKKLSWDNKSVPITGVIADFNHGSIHEAIRPLLISSWENNHKLFSVALPVQAKPDQWKTAIAAIEKAYNKVYPADDFEYRFFDEDIAAYYEQEQHIDSLLKWATGLSIVISCLGLLGLVIYTTGQRTKEIGVRKVLGASVPQIATLISKEFLVLVLLAFLIAIPIAWLGIHQWLQNFAYRSPVSIWVFVFGGVIAILVALLTISFQTIKAALANPVKSLRTE